MNTNSLSNLKWTLPSSSNQKSMNSEKSKSWGAPNTKSRGLTNILNLKLGEMNLPSFHFGTGVTFNSTRTPKEKFESYSTGKH